MRNKNNSGFSLIELLVVISIIGFLASIVTIALSGGRQKSRDTKRLADMAQMIKALELYFLTNRGYPAATVAGIPDAMTPNFVASLPSAPTPADGSCTGVVGPSPANPANTYYYEPQGTPYVVSGVTVYPSYNYYFCLGVKAGNLGPGLHIVNPSAIQ